MAPKKENNKRVSQAELEATKERLKVLDQIIAKESKVRSITDEKLQLIIDEKIEKSKIISQNETIHHEVKRLYNSDDCLAITQ